MKIWNCIERFRGSVCCHAGDSKDTNQSSKSVFLVKNTERDAMGEERTGLQAKIEAAMQTIGGEDDVFYKKRGGGRSGNRSRSVLLPCVSHICVSLSYQAICTSLSLTQ